MAVETGIAVLKFMKTHGEFLYFLLLTSLDSAYNEDSFFP